MTEETKKKEAPEEPGGDKAQGGHIPPLDFSSFVLSLSSSVLISLGVVENPVTGKKEKDVPVARQTIDLITLLKEKTKGNLTEEEARLVDDVLRELQIWYVKHAQ